MYEVILAFRDDADKNYTYYTGDTYPRARYKPSKSRIAYLSGNSNRCKCPVIREKGKSAPDADGPRVAE